MWQNFLLAVILAPIAAVAVCWCCWVVVVSADWLVTKTRGHAYRRRLYRDPEPPAMTELQLAQRLWEVDWLRRHNCDHAYWDRENLSQRFHVLYQQLELKQISREAHEMWQKDKQQKLVSKYKNLF